MFSDWHKADGKNRHVNLRKAILNVLKHLTNLSKEGFVLEPGDLCTKVVKSS